MTTPDDMQHWLQHGIERGWCSDICCATHEGATLTDDEYHAYHSDEDICTFSVRIYPNGNPKEH